MSANSEQQIAHLLRDVLSDYELRVDEHLGGGADLVLHLDGRTLTIDVKAVPTIDPTKASRLPRRQAVGERIAVLVADRIPDGSRDALRRRGWSYLDRRGRLYLRGPGLLIDSDIAGVGRPMKTQPGRAWREVVFALLGDPSRRWGVRELAREVQLSPASVSKQLGLLREAHLIDESHRPLVPELFWELASSWRSESVNLARRPSPDDSRTLGFGMESPDEPGWALTGTMGALSWGASIPVGNNWPPDFLVPSPDDASRALRRLGPAPEPTTRGCAVRVAPVRQAIQPRFDPPHRLTEWLVAHPLAVALDLAQDKARGVELLEDWKPEGFARVW